MLMLCRHVTNALSYSTSMAITPITKAHLRNRIRAELKRMPVEDRRARSSAICDRLAPFIRQAGSVALFAPRPDEPDLKFLDSSGLWTGRTVLFPRLDGSTLTFAPAANWAELQPGKFGLLTPIRQASSLEPHLVLVPGLAFNRRGDRLGRGAGFYDRYLTDLDPAVITIGVAFHLQLVDDLPREAHDFRVRTVVTEHETIQVTGVECRVPGVG
jgi:5-formyltetrahydrofolate cyclo-ligase